MAMDTLNFGVLDPIKLPIAKNSTKRTTLLGSQKAMNAS
ncbi:hypothetical protein JCM19240_63 [Vibrio maritimus]|uniref:Uncharacterized protein n=1 Tax=Vibrio maritimus TaxID=990268 RepID=A0A090TEW1_9VIBR|nr:hypothetical protein JCM19240_63 [Vibrio maritimus]